MLLGVLTVIVIATKAIIKQFCNTMAITSLALCGIIIVNPVLWYKLLLLLCHDLKLLFFWPPTQTTTDLLQVEITFSWLYIHQPEVVFCGICYSLKVRWWQLVSCINVKKRVIGWSWRILSHDKKWYFNTHTVASVSTMCKARKT